MDDRETTYIPCGSYAGMEFLHYTKTPLRLHWKLYHQKVTHKPDGLWISVKGPRDWEEFCRSEQFHVEYLKSYVPIKLKPDASVLVLDSDPAILLFTRAYCVPSKIQNFPMDTHFIDWPAVTRRWSGIIIAPYSHRLRLDPRTNWYYGWDCASGCIWGMEAIDEDCFSRLRRRSRTLKMPTIAR